MMQAVREILGERFTRLAPQQLSRRSPVQAPQPKGRQIGAIEQRRLPLAHGKDDSDWIGDEAAEREEQGVRARPIQPVRVIHQYRYRGRIRVSGEQAEGSRAYREAAVRARRPERERTLQRGCLRARDPADQGQRRAQQLKQAAEGNLRLRLNPPRPQQLHAARLLLGVAEERRLADPRLPHYSKDAAVVAAGLLKQPDERQLLMITAEQHVSECTETPDTKPRHRHPA